MGKQYKWNKEKDAIKKRKKKDAFSDLGWGMW
jgi:hypothetical protein